MSEIRLCKDRDLDDLKMFLHKYWQKNHILSISETLMNFQHSNIDGYNFVLSFSKGEINGVLGFIEVAKYDIQLSENRDIWLAIWKIIDEKNNQGVGFSLFKWLVKNVNPKSIGAIGINRNVRKFYEILGYKTGEMNHYFIKNPYKSILKIADIQSNFSKPTTIDKSTRIFEIKNKDLNKIKYSSYPRKSNIYLQKRYVNHPYYNYKIFGVFYNDQLSLILVIRKIFVSGSNCLKIVDMQGDFFGVKSIINPLIELMIKNDSEFIDCLNFGLSEEIFYQLGFMKKNKELDIIPNYFEPFKKINNQILFAFKAEREYCIFKGDSDQDRPNQIIS